MYNFFRRKIKIIFFSPLGLIFLVINKFIKIKLFRIQATRIGGLVCDFGFYFNEKRKKRNKNKKIILFFEEGKFCNEALKKMIERKIDIPLASQKWPFKVVNYFFNTLYYYLIILKKEKEFMFKKKKDLGRTNVKTKQTIPFV